MISFFIPGHAVGKGRPRIGKVGAHSRMFTPAKTVNYEGLVAMAAQQAMAGRALIEGAVRVRMHIDCQVPASWSKRKQALALSLAIRPTTKPDVDNVVKACFDALNGVVWKDDVQAVSLTVSKSYGATPGVIMVIETLAEGNL